jgi:hypothetical protein
MYGTHVTNNVKLGSLFGYRFEMKSDEVSKLKSMGMNVSFSVTVFFV